METCQFFPQTILEIMQTQASDCIFSVEKNVLQRYQGKNAFFFNLFFSSINWMKFTALKYNIWESIQHCLIILKSQKTSTLNHSKKAMQFINSTSLWLPFSSRRLLKMLTPRYSLLTNSKIKNYPGKTQINHLKLRRISW